MPEKYGEFFKMMDAYNVSKQEKPKKEKKKRPRSKAQIASFDKARKVRAANLAKRKKTLKIKK